MLQPTNDLPPLSHVTEKMDPCEKLSCSLGSQCVRSKDGTEAKCECLESCPSLGDHEGAGPVCGTDGVDYPSLCDLNRHACASTANISVAFRGKCGKPCLPDVLLSRSVCRELARPNLFLIGYLHLLQNIYYLSRRFTYLGLIGLSVRLTCLCVCSLCKYTR
jgi:hypothetical protein